MPLEISITRMAATNEAGEGTNARAGEGDERTENRTMGRKHIVPYGLYRAHGFVSAKLAERTGFSEDDLDLALGRARNMFEHDRSAARGEMATRKAIAFKHATALGNAPAHDLFERVTGRPQYRRRVPLRSIAGWTICRRRGGSPTISVEIDRDGLPEGVEIIEWL